MSTINQSNTSRFSREEIGINFRTWKKIFIRGKIAPIYCIISRKRVAVDLFSSSCWYRTAALLNSCHMPTIRLRRCRQKNETVGSEEFVSGRFYTKTFVEFVLFLFAASYSFWVKFWEFNFLYCLFFSCWEWFVNFFQDSLCKIYSYWLVFTSTSSKLTQTSVEILLRA